MADLSPSPSPRLGGSPEAFGTTYEESIARSDDDWIERLSSGVESSHQLLLMAELRRGPIGLAWGKMDPSDRSTTVVYHMWVAAEGRRRGVARLLLETLTEWARSKGASAVTLGVTVGNVPASQLYEQAGFKPVGEPEPLRPGSARMGQDMQLELRDSSAGDIEFVDFSPDHLDPLILMWRASFERALGMTDPHPLEDQKQYFIEKILPHHHVRVALLGAQVVGFCAASDRSVAQLYIHTEFQGRGIGTAFLAWAKEQSGGCLCLCAFERNKLAQRFYERHGFRVVGRGVEETWNLEDVKYEWTRPD